MQKLTGYNYVAAEKAKGRTASEIACILLRYVLSLLFKLSLCLTHNHAYKLVCTRTVNLGVVGAAVEEDAHGQRAAIEDRVAVDLDVVATLRGDDACREVGFGDKRAGGDFNKST